MDKKARLGNVASNIAAGTITAGIAGGTLYGINKLVGAAHKLLHKGDTTYVPSYNGVNPNYDHAKAEHHFDKSLSYNMVADKNVGTPIGDAAEDKALEHWDRYKHYEVPNYMKDYTVKDLDVGDISPSYLFIDRGDTAYTNACQESPEGYTDKSRNRDYELMSMHHAHNTHVSGGVGWYGNNRNGQ